MQRATPWRYQMKTEVVMPHNEYPIHVRDHVVAKLETLERFFEGTVSVRAVLERQHSEHRIELVANVRRGIVLVIDAHADSMSAALDNAVERMGRVLARHKDKLKRNIRARA
jgi:ribosomal subunit interface protein